MTIFEPRRDQTNISHLCSIDKADPKLPQQDELEKTKKKKNNTPQADPEFQTDIPYNF